MSKIQGTPFVNKVLKTLTDNQKLLLASLINGSNDNPVFRSLINPANYINNDDKGFVKHIILEAQDQTFTGYLIYNDTYCVLFAYDKKKQSVDVVNIDNVKKTYEFVREHLTILELRFSLEEEKESVDVKQIVQDAIEDGEIEVNNENVITVNAVDLSTGSTTKVLSNDDWLLATDNTKGCSMVLKLVAQNVYPLGSEIELKRVSLGDNLVKFAMTFNNLSGTKYITYIVTGIFAPTSGTISVTELEANKETIPVDAPSLSNLTVGGQTYKIGGNEKKLYYVDYEYHNRSYSSFHFGIYSTNPDNPLFNSFPTEKAIYVVHPPYGTFNTAYGPFYSCCGMTVTVNANRTSVTVSVDGLKKSTYTFLTDLEGNTGQVEVSKMTGYSVTISKTQLAPQPNDISYSYTVHEV